MEKNILWAALLFLTVLMLFVMIRVVKGPRFTDRIIAVNSINTMIIAGVCILSVYLGADYLIDVALIYALLGFMANVLLMRTLIAKHVHNEKEDEE